MQYGVSFEFDMMPKMEHRLSTFSTTHSHGNGYGSSTMTMNLSFEVDIQL